MFQAITLIVLFGILPSTYAGACPDLPSMRSDFIKSTFDPTKLAGFFTEQAYSDIAQVGSSCQTLNVTSAPSGLLSMDFSVKYGPLPFTITEVYTPEVVDPPSPGLFEKNADVPGGKFLKLPTVLVDVAEDYSAMTIYSCLEVGGQAVRELVIATREEEADEDYVRELIDQAIEAGVDIDADKIKRSSC
ncbi:hypothetical protein TrRE_jg7148 [Triparma retinervis]|uniref:Uncharacterized protein n=1 Tax=Triparma retinervis TaxID=2557542 RepID=A0A9W7G8Z5_9STRA|nr:hypothetical protein TrRE_jg7148 [Triparma retinervis]